ncbi:MAG: cytochrome c biogenesis protein CcdA, partial [Gemmatimonadales bacterium]
MRRGRGVYQRASRADAAHHRRRVPFSLPHAPRRAARHLPCVPRAHPGGAVNTPENLGFFVAFAAGVLSFLSPCVLPLVPSYLGFLTGMTLEEMSGRRRMAMIHALLFVFGFALIFVILGASATALGSALKYYQVWLQRVGGVLIIVFGLYAMGVFKFRFLQMEQRVHLDRKPIGYLGSVLV